MTPTYKLEELAAEAGVSPRTVRYYVQRGLLPAPEFRGKDTAYGREHLLRLQAVKRLQQARLPLDEIQVRLAGASEAEIGRIARGEAEVKPRLPFDEPRDSGSVKKAPHPYRAAPPGEGPFEERRPTSLKELLRDSEVTAHVVRLADGVELWVRSDLPSSSRTIVREILDQFVSLTDKDQGR